MSGTGSNGSLKQNRESSNYWGVLISRLEVASHNFCRDEGQVDSLHLKLPYPVLTYALLLLNSSQIQLSPVWLIHRPYVGGSTEIRSRGDRLCYRDCLGEDLGRSPDFLVGEKAHDTQLPVYVIGSRQ